MFEDTPFRRATQRAMKNAFINKNPWKQTIVWNGEIKDVVSDSRIEMAQNETDSVNIETRTLHFNKADFSILPVNSKIKSIKFSFSV